MAATQNINVRVDADVKTQAEAILSELGLPTSTAINIFLKAIIRRKGIPFDMMLGTSSQSVRKDEYDRPIHFMPAIKSDGKNMEVNHVGME